MCDESPWRSSLERTSHVFGWFVGSGIRKAGGQGCLVSRPTCREHPRAARRPGMGGSGSGGPPEWALWAGVPGRPSHHPGRLATNSEPCSYCGLGSGRYGL
jgi:hypothetical protein